MIMLENVLLNLEDKIKDLFINENSGYDITHLWKIIYKLFWENGI